MIQKPFDSINKTDIDNLIQNQVVESRTIEYKQALPGNSDDDKREFLADVSSFANGGGGDLLFGIVAHDGVPQNPTGLNIVADIEILRLENILREGLGPRIQGIRFLPISGFPNGIILLLRIPMSWNSPHMITFKNLSRFFTRNSRGKYQMDVSELKSAFDFSESMTVKILRFRDERLARIIAGETPVSMVEGPKLILHILPMSSFGSSFSLDISQLEQQQINLMPIRANGWDHRINLDGIVTYTNIRDRADFLTYCQIYRAGQIEAVNAGLVIENQGEYFIDTLYELDVIDAVTRYLTVLKTLNVSCPIVVLITLIGVAGAHLDLIGNSRRALRSIDL